MEKVVSVLEVDVPATPERRNIAVKWILIYLLISVPVWVFMLGACKAAGQSDEASERAFAEFMAAKMRGDVDEGSCSGNDERN